MPKQTMIVLIEIEAEDEDEMPNTYELATAMACALHNEDGDPFTWGDPTVYNKLSDLVADCDDGLNPNLSR